MRVFLRTSRRTGVSMPFPLAILVGLVWLAVWVAVVFYGLIAVALIWLGRGCARGVRAWRGRRS